MDNVSLTMNPEERNHHPEVFFVLREKQDRLDKQRLEEARCMFVGGMSHPQIETSSHTHDF